MSPLAPTSSLMTLGRLPLAGMCIGCTPLVRSRLSLFSSSFMRLFFVWSHPATCLRHAHEKARRGVHLAGLLFLRSGLAFALPSPAGQGMTRISPLIALAFQLSSVNLLFLWFAPLTKCQLSPSSSLVKDCLHHSQRYFSPCLRKVPTLAQ